MLQTRQQMKARQNLAGQRFTHDANGGARVVEDEPIVGFPQHRVDWDWNRTDLDSAQEAGVERGTVVQEQDGALLGGKADGAQDVAGTIHQRIELAVGDRRALGNQGNAIAASLAHVAGDEIVGDVEGVGYGRQWYRQGQEGFLQEIRRSGDFYVKTPDLLISCSQPPDLWFHTI